MPKAVERSGMVPLKLREKEGCEAAVAIFEVKGFVIWLTVGTGFLQFLDVEFVALLRVSDASVVRRRVGVG